jgi:hypothetical protein
MDSEVRDIEAYSYGSYLNAQSQTDEFDRMKGRIEGIIREFNKRCPVRAAQATELEHYIEIIKETLDDLYHSPIRECERIIEKCDDKYRMA